MADDVTQHDGLVVHAVPLDGEASPGVLSQKNFILKAPSDNTVPSITRVRGFRLIPDRSEVCVRVKWGRRSISPHGRPNSWRPGPGCSGVRVPAHDAPGGRCHHRSAGRRTRPREPWPAHRTMCLRRREHIREASDAPDRHPSARARVSGRGLASCGPLAYAWPMKTLVHTALLLTLVSTTARAQVNAGEQKPEPSQPFTMTQVATFNLPWRIAFLPDARMLITEKPGALWLVTQQGAKTPVDERAGRPPRGAGRHAGRLPLAALRRRPQRLPDLRGAGRRRVEPRPRAGQAGDRRGHGACGQPGRARGAVAPDAQGQGWTVRRRDRLFPRRPVPVPDGRRAPAHDARPGSGPGAGQDPAPDARRQARARQSDGREDGRGNASR